jgi:hypothetical protein
VNAADDSAATGWSVKRLLLHLGLVVLVVVVAVTVFSLLVFFNV